MRVGNGGGRKAMLLVVLTMAGVGACRPLGGLIAPGGDPCSGPGGPVGEGRPCIGVPDPDPRDCRTPLCINGRCQSDAPVADDRACVDGLRVACSTTRCVPLTGRCERSPAPDGTTCRSSGDARGDCKRFACAGGDCRATADPSDLPVAAAVHDPALVEVTTQKPRIEQRTAWTDCCVFCEEQWLEALAPTVTGPIRTGPGGGLPERVTFCGEVMRYGVNDELADPRDIMINIAPRAPAFQQHVAGFINTECTPLTGTNRTRFGVKDDRCDESACRAAAAAWDAEPESAGHPARCLHAEITPAEQFYGEDSQFLPISDSGSCGGSWDCQSVLEPGPGRAHGANVCVHGVYAIDHGPDHGDGSHKRLCCSTDTSHDRPEIHPMDAIWFRAPDDAGWIFGVFQDDSNRYSFPHCDDDHNGNAWSQAPRDVTLRFPFRLTGAELPACVRVRPLVTRKAGAEHRVNALNVTTAGRADLFAEHKELGRDPIRAVPPLVEVREQAGFEGETQVSIEGCSAGGAAAGFLTVRVAVGCDSRFEDCSQARLKALDPSGRNDASDAGSGFYLGEVRFERGACDGAGGTGVLMP